MARDCLNMSLPFTRAGVETLPPETLAAWVKAGHDPKPDDDGEHERDSAEEDSDSGECEHEELALGDLGPLLAEAWRELLEEADAAVARDKATPLAVQEEVEVDEENLGDEDEDAR